MESEKVKEIKKSLACCKQNEIENTCEYCGNCPASNWDYETECNVELFQKALTLINHQDFQISTLKVQFANLEKELKKEQIKHLYYRQDSQFKESRIAELEKENKNKTDTITDLLKKQEFYEKEKLKQFAEMLKDNPKIKKIVDEGWIVSYVELCNAVDETLKEFIK